jgi:hypothetical protein
LPPCRLAATILKLADGSLGGDLSGSSINSVKIIEVQIQDSTLKFAVNATEDIKASFVLIVSGDSISGRWSMPGDSSTVSGHRLHDKSAGTPRYAPMGRMSTGEPPPEHFPLRLRFGGLCAGDRSFE